MGIINSQQLISPKTGEGVLQAEERVKLVSQVAAQYLASRVATSPSELYVDAVVNTAWDIVRHVEARQLELQSQEPPTTYMSAFPRS